MRINWIQRSVAVLLALLIAGLFAYFILAKPNLFNFLPCAIDNALNFGGISESALLRFFDVVFTLFLFILSYKVLCRIFTGTLSRHGKLNQQ